MAPRYSACSALATHSTPEEPCEGLVWLAINPSDQERK